MKKNKKVNIDLSQYSLGEQVAIILIALALVLAIYFLITLGITWIVSIAIIGLFSIKVPFWTLFFWIVVFDILFNLLFPRNRSNNG